MTYRSDIDDALLAKQYTDGVLISQLQIQFGASTQTLRRHLRAKGIVPNRKVSTPWNLYEECQLYDAKKLGLTGAELQAAVPSRSLYGIKGHVVFMGTRGIDLSTDVDVLQ